MESVSDAIMKLFWIEKDKTREEPLKFFQRLDASQRTNTTVLFFFLCWYCVPFGYLKRVIRTNNHTEIVKMIRYFTHIFISTHKTRYENLCYDFIYHYQSLSQEYKAILGSILCSKVTKASELYDGTDALLENLFHIIKSVTKSHHDLITIIRETEIVNGLRILKEVGKSWLHLEYTEQKNEPHHSVVEKNHSKYHNRTNSNNI